MPRKIVIGFTLIAFLVIGVSFFSQSRTYNYLPKPTAAKEKTPKKNPDIALLFFGQVGEGEGGKWHSSPDLTDVIILIYYQPAKNKLSLISIPRDLYGDFGGEDFKVNEVIVRNKMPDFLNKLPEITGIKTDNYVVADLNLVKTVVNQLAGVDINLKYDVTDSVTGYTMKTGPHHLNGDDTIWLIRNRFAPLGDFFRETNQHLVIKTIIQRYEKMNILEKIKFLAQITPNINWVRTNVNLSEVMPSASKNDTIEVQSVILDPSTNLLKNATTIVGTSTEAILVPQKGLNKYDEIKNFILNKIYGNE